MERSASLDSLRGVAVVLVVASHSLSHLAPLLVLENRIEPGGWGVRLFFVLSGYLITSILLRAEPAASARPWASYGVFLVHRALRILPPAYVVLAVCWWYGIPEVSAHGWWYVAYLGNVHMAARDVWPDGVGHFWSLGVEEQFYLLWPWVIWRCPAERRRATLWVVCGLALIGRAALGDGSHVAELVLMPARMDGLAVGALLALQPWRADWSALAGVALLLQPWWPLQESGAVLVAAAAVALAVQHPGAVSVWPLRWIGVRSYGIYLWHGPLLYWYGTDHLAWALLWSLLLPAASWILIEQPCQVWRRRLRYPSPQPASRPLTVYS